MRILDHSSRDSIDESVGRDKKRRSQGKKCRMRVIPNGPLTSESQADDSDGDEQHGDHG